MRAASRRRASSGFTGLSATGEETIAVADARITPAVPPASGALNEDVDGTGTGSIPDAPMLALSDLALSETLVISGLKAGGRDSTGCRAGAGPE